MYFPTTEKAFAEVRDKFVSDLRGVERNQADGFVFLSNQRVTLEGRAALRDLVAGPSEIYDVERLRHVLDSPKGYGLRLEYLRRAMTLKEQVAFFNELQGEMTRQLLEHQRGVEAKLDLILERTTAAPGALAVGMSSIVDSADVVGELGAPMSELNAGTLSLLHRVLTEDGPMAAAAGRFRNVQVWVGSAENPVFVPPPPEEVPDRLVALLKAWRFGYEELRRADRETIIEGLARLHHSIVSIHPFLDANGRIARLLTDHSARELLGQRIGPELIADPEVYFSSLQAADRGDLDPLAKLIAAALT